MKYFSADKVLYYVVLGLIGYMPFHLFLSHWLSVYTGGLGQWDAAKDVVTLVALILSVMVAVRRRLFSDKLVRSVFIIAAVYGLLHMAFWLFDQTDQDARSFIVATLFNGRIIAYLFIGLIVAHGRSYSLRTAMKVLLVASTITCIFALVQYALPKDLMTHFGYSIERGVRPAFFIDDKPDFPRVMSTIRDPNSYGAYLVLPITALWLMLGNRRFRSMKVGGVIVLHLLALFLTFSRGAWIGTIIAVGLATFLMYKHHLYRVTKKYAPFLIAGVLVFAGLAYAFKNTYVFQNVILHSDKSTVLADPNELRVQLQRKAYKDIANDPEGHGPGTSGIVSIGNPKGTFLTENYFLQIGYELGVLGLGLFLSLLLIVYIKLHRSADYMVRNALLCSFWAYLFISTLIHLWSNEAVAAQWWLLVGLVLGHKHILRKSGKIAGVK